jgi:DNA modification methylase
MTFNLYLGNCLDYINTVNSVNAVITDPPYNIGFKYNNYKDKLSDKDYIKLIGSFYKFPLSMIHYPEEFIKYYIPALGNPTAVSAWCYNTDTPRHFRLVGYWGGLMPNYNKIKQPYKNLNDRRVQKSISNGSKGAPLYEWWDDIHIVNNVSKEKTDHPCQVPVALMKRIINLTTNEGDTIFDPFMGSGTTGIACMELGRNFIGCEIDPIYFAIAEKRIYEASLQPHLFLDDKVNNFVKQAELV